MGALLRTSTVAGLISLLVPLTLLIGPLPVVAAPSVRLVAPVNGATVTGPDVTVQAEIMDVTLIDGRQATKREDLHMHYVLDLDLTPYLDGVRDLPLGDPTIVHTTATTHTFTNVAPGAHRVTGILTYSDHKVSQPVVMSEVRFTVVATGMPAAPRAGGGHGVAPPTAPLLAGLLGLALLGGGLAVSRRARPRHP